MLTELKSHQARLSQTTLNTLFAQDPDRVRRYHIKTGDLTLDYSKQLIDDAALNALLALAEQMEVKAATKAMFQGEKINASEGRAVLHTALRAPHSMHQALISQEKAKMFALIKALRTREWQGAKGDKITDVVNLGIGGSDLGPFMASHALKAYHQAGIRCHFVSNIDPTTLEDTLKILNPASTLFIIASKSFSTPETLANAELAKAWLKSQLNTEELSDHFLAITAKPEKAQAFGLSAERILAFWDWVGGRYSLWSAIGFPLALLIGEEHFNAFLQGAHDLDTHFQTAPLSENMPVIMALLGVWYHQYWQAPTQAILPYADNLKYFPDYLQQMDMESNGKSVTTSGEQVSYPTGPIIWGQPGTNGQHAFYQLLHQGTHFVPIDFILPIETHAHNKANHQALMANCLAQASALMMGKNADNPADVMPGNKPSNLLLLKALTPYALGQLIALYEHKVFVQGVIWQLNSFDQPGVELGKVMAKSVLAALTGQSASGAFDPSTQAHIENLIGK